MLSCKSQELLDNSAALFPSPMAVSPPVIPSDIAQVYRMSLPVLPDTGALAEASASLVRPLSRVTEQIASATESSNSVAPTTWAVSPRSNNEDDSGTTPHSRKLRELLTRPASSRVPPSPTPSLPPHTPGAQSASGLASEPDRLSCSTAQQQTLTPPQQSLQQQSLQQQSLPQVLQQPLQPQDTLLSSPVQIKREMSEFKFSVPNSSPPSAIFASQSIERKSSATSAPAPAPEHNTGIDRSIASARVSTPAPIHPRVGHPSAPAAAQLSTSLVLPASQLALPVAPLPLPAPHPTTPAPVESGGGGVGAGDSILKTLLSQDDDASDVYSLSHARSSLLSSSRPSLLSRASSSSFHNVRSPEQHMAPPESPVHTLAASAASTASSKSPPVSVAVTCAEGRPPSHKRRNTSLSNVQSTTAAAAAAPLPLPVTGSATDMKTISALAASTLGGGRSAGGGGNAIGSRFALNLNANEKGVSSCQVLDPSIESSAFASTPLVSQLVSAQAPVHASRAPLPPQPVVSKPTASVAPFQHRQIISTDVASLGASQFGLPGGFSFAGICGPPFTQQPENIKNEPDDLLSKLLLEQQMSLAPTAKLEAPSTTPTFLALEPIVLASGALLPPPAEQQQPAPGTVTGSAHGPIISQLLQRTPAQQAQLLKELSSDPSGAAQAAAASAAAERSRTASASGPSEQSSAKQARDRRRSGGGASKRRHSQVQRPEACEPSAQQQQSEAAASNSSELATSPVAIPTRASTPVGGRGRRSGVSEHNGSPRRTSAGSSVAPPSHLLGQPMLELDGQQSYMAQLSGGEPPATGVPQAGSPFSSGRGSPRSHQQQSVPPASSPNSTPPASVGRELLMERLRQRAMHSNAAISPGVQHQQMLSPPPLPPAQISPAGSARYDRQASMCGSENLVSSSSSDMGLVSTTSGQLLPDRESLASAPQPVAAEKSHHSRSGAKQSRGSRSASSAAESAGAAQAAAACTSSHAAAAAAGAMCEQQSYAIARVTGLQPLPLMQQRQQAAVALETPNALVRLMPHSLFIIITNYVQCAAAPHQIADCNYTTQHNTQYKTEQHNTQHTTLDDCVGTCTMLCIRPQTRAHSRLQHSMPLRAPRELFTIRCAVLH